MASMIRVVTRDQSLEEARRAVIGAWEPLNPPSPYVPGVRSARPDTTASLANLHRTSPQSLPSGRVCSAAARLAAAEHHSEPAQIVPQSGLHILAAEESVLRDEVVLDYMRASLRLLLVYCESMATLESNFSPSERIDVKESWDRDVIQRAEARERLCYESELAVLLKLDAKREHAILQEKIASLLPDFYTGRRALQMEEHHALAELLQWHKENRPFGAGGFGSWMGGGAQTSRAASAAVKSIEDGRPPKHSDKQDASAAPKSEVYRQQILASRSCIAQQERYLSNLGVLQTQNRLSFSQPYAATVPSTPLNHEFDVVATVRPGGSSSATPRTFKMLGAPPGRRATSPPPSTAVSVVESPAGASESADAATRLIRADGTENGVHMENLIAATLSAEWVDGWGQYGNDTSLIQIGRDAWMKTKEERYEMFKRRAAVSDLAEQEASVRRELKSEEISAWLKMLSQFDGEVEIAEHRAAESRRRQLLIATDNAVSAAVLSKRS